MAPFRWLSRIGCGLAAASMLGCAATIGDPNPGLLEKMRTEGAFGAEQQVRICALLDTGIAESTVRRLVEEAWNETEAGALGLTVRIVSSRRWRREGNDAETMLRNIQKIPIAAGCDRLLAFVGHSDTLVSDLGGAVTLAHGLVLASAESLRYGALTPTEAVRHEIYHLVGCGHAPRMDECYRRIARAKGRRKSADAFFPVFLYILDEDIEKYCGVNALIDERAEANRIAKLWVGQKERQATGAPPPARPCPPAGQS